MIFKILTLKLITRQEPEIIHFDHHITVFHGKVSSGKSTITRLIDYCLGGKLEWTPALRSELRSVQLSIVIGSYNVLLERGRTNENFVRVTWENNQLGKDEKGSDNVPIKDQNLPPIIADDIFTLSDLFYYFLGLTPIKVKKNKKKTSSESVRLSFRDILWYCILKQEDFDSSFFRLNEMYLQSKSRNVMRFIVGDLNERISQLEIEIGSAEKQKDELYKQIELIRGFLKEMELENELEISERIEHATTELQDLESEFVELRQNYASQTHFVDQLRNDLRQLETKLDIEKRTLEDLNERIEGQESLKAELISSKIKLARGEASNEILGGVTFSSCPSCGRSIKTHKETNDSCHLCKQDDPLPQKSDINEDVIINDLNTRLSDLEESLNRLNFNKVRQKRIVTRTEEKKSELDSQLSIELLNYDSIFLSNTRAIERNIAALRERITGLNRLRVFTESISELYRKIEEQGFEIEQLQSEMSREKLKLESVDGNIRAIEQMYIDALVKVELPGVHFLDTIEINRNSWIPSIQPIDGKGPWNYDSAGSGGKKTLLKVTYALALHIVAREKNLPLPPILIIDSPMKNISEDVNIDLFHNFYRYLYEEARSSLSDTQIIIVDKEFRKPDLEDLDVYDRYMTPDEAEHPPLIRYYRGA